MEQIGLGGVIALAAVSMVAGALNAAAGGGSLLTFPTLLAVGVPPVGANVTNTVALVPGYLGGIAGYRRELDGQRANVRRLLPAAVLGAVLGATILLTTSTRVFRVLVPVLVGLAAVLLLCQPILQRRLSTLHPETGAPMVHDHHRLTIPAVFAAAVYGGYFGGVLGVILLAVLGLTMTDHLQRLNGLKSVLQFAINLIAVVVFAIFGPVRWWLVLVMAPASLLGGWLGAHGARRLPPRVLRTTVGVYGLGCAVVLAFTLR